jgi:hypothetical protein
MVTGIALWNIVSLELPPTYAYPQDNRLKHYWVLSGDAIHRISDAGEKLVTYTNRFLGTPASLDPSDPFKVMVFYQQHQQIVLIDNQGVPIGKPITLSNFDVGEIWLACRSARGGIWLYNRNRHELRLTNPQINKIELSIALPRRKTNGYPNKMTEYNGVIYLGVNNQYIERIDSYGAALEPLNITYSNEFLVDDKYIWIRNNDLWEKRPIEKPYEVSDFFACPSTGFPLVFNGKPFYFDGKTLTGCEKINR